MDCDAMAKVGNAAGNWDDVQGSAGAWQVVELRGKVIGKSAQLSG